MHGATASTPRLIASCTTGAARSTSHVVKMIFAPPPSSRCAHDFAVAGLLPCVSHVLICSGRPPTPPFAFHCLTRTWAAARAGPSNGAMPPLLSNAQPIVIGVVAVLAAEARTVPTTAAVAATSATSAASASQVLRVM